MGQLENRIIIVRELKEASQGALSAWHDRVVTFEEMESYVPPEGVNAFQFRGVIAGSVAGDWLTTGRLLEGENLSVGETYLVGCIIDPDKYINSLLPEQAGVVRWNLSYEVMVALCQHPNGEVSEVRGDEIIYDPETGLHTPVPALVRDGKLSQWSPGF